MKAIAIEIGDCSFPLHSTPILYKIETNFRQTSITLYPLLYGSLSFILCLIGNHFYTSCFLFEIDHDDGTVNTDYVA